MDDLYLDIPESEIFQYHNIEDHELICELEKTSTVLHGLFTEIVRQFYREGDGYIKGVPCGTVWRADPQKTGIWIDTELRWEDNHPEFRPAIFVKLSDINFEQWPVPSAQHIGMRLKSAEYMYSRKGTGTVTFMHVAATAGEAELLCDNTASYLRSFQDVIRQDFCFLTFSEISRKPISQSSPESRERYTSSTTFTYSFGEKWGIKRESPILKSVDVVSPIRGVTGSSSSNSNRPSHIIYPGSYEDLEKTSVHVPGKIASINTDKVQPEL